MGKKANKKLKDLARLQALYGDAQVPTTSGQDFHQAPVAQPHPTDLGHLNVKTAHHHAPVANDLRVVVGLIVLMSLMLVAVYWLVANTAFAEWLVSLGRGIN
ncbi:MAG: hypothetical protein R3B38_02985 [Patescibacteria group bacterium]